MGHTINLDDRSGLIDSDTLQDFIDIFFAARDSEFLIEVVPTYGPVPNQNIRGLCQASSTGRFKITLYAGNIKAHTERKMPVGGNTALAADLRLGVYLVLTHELRHAYQHVYFGKNSTLHRGRYKARAGEVDARRHVDENYENICEFLGVRGERCAASPNPDFSIYMDILSEGASPDGVVRETEDQIWDQVMEMPGDPEVSYRLIMDGMAARGLRLG